MTGKEALNELIENYKIDLQKIDVIYKPFYDYRNFNLKWLEEHKIIILKDLEKLEQYEKIFDTPLIEIRKRLEVLEILEDFIELKYDEVNEIYYLEIGTEDRIPLSDDYERNICILEISDEEAEKFKQWLEGD